MSDDEKTSQEYGAEGGKKRAARLSPEERSDIARAAAVRRWGDAGRLYVKATHEAPLNVGSTELAVAVLEGGVRVVRAATVLTALGRPWRGQYRRTGLPSFLEAKNLNPFITNELRDVLEVIEYTGLTGKRQLGYRAEIIPLVCELYLSAREVPDVLTATQKETARLAETLMRGLARVGITALIDEATGYQEVRDRRALEAILNRFLSAEAAKWAKRFPDDFYDEIFRLRKWDWERKGSRRPVQIAKDTINLVYMRIMPELLPELEVRNPKAENGYRKKAHHQFFSIDIGLPALGEHIRAVTTLMRAFDTWDEFKQRLDRALPIKTKITDLPLWTQPVAIAEPSKEP